jgi:hypothetical protein
MRTLALIAVAALSALAARATAQGPDTTVVSCRYLPGGLASPGYGAVAGITLACPGNRLSLSYQFNAGGARLDYVGRYQSLSLHAVAISSEFQWYYGLGNATPFNNDSGFGPRYYRARQSYFEVNPGWTTRVAPHTDVTVGPDMRYWETGSLGGFVDSTRPYGVGPFGTIGGLVEARFRARRLDIRIIGRGVPDAWDAQHAYGTLRAIVVTRIDLPTGIMAPTLALRLGADKVWGDAPFQDLAHIAVRGYLPERYTGDASALLDGQFEMPLGKTEIIVPVTIGLMAINDVGRVFAPGDNASAWHDGWGGGVFARPADRHYTMSLSAVRGSEGTRVYLGLGREF